LVEMIIRRSTKLHEIMELGEYGLSKRWVFVLIFFLFIFTTSPSLSLGAASSPENNGSTNDSPVAAWQVNLSNQQNSTSTANFTNASITTALNLKYIWSISGIEKDQITMALDQEGNDLFGKAKYEPENGEPWNGVVAGSISENRVHLAMAAIKGRELVSIVLDGILADGAISGEFFQSSEGRTPGSGEFNAVSINPDLSSYVPAKVNVLGPEMPVPVASATNVYAPSAASQKDQQAAVQKSRFHDVHLDADRIQTGVGDISQIPIGMG
jgi:hypothetical protein